LATRRKNRHNVVMTAALRLLAVFGLSIATLRPGVAAELSTYGTSMLCDQAISSAEGIWKMPPGLLGAVAAVESGRADPGTKVIRPWPWTINAEGAGQFFATKAQAIAAVKALRRQGVQSIDVGCLQVNLMYHPEAFASLDAAFDPFHNARYAAKFLNSLYFERRNWPHAIGTYHSRTAGPGANYRELVMARWEHPTLARTELGHPVYRDFLTPTRNYKSGISPTRSYASVNEHR
jgi:soluble lytic murein transglycosylase-like protein